MTPHSLNNLMHFQCVDGNVCTVQVKSWSLGRRGLRYDRQWMVVTEAGVCVSQKRAAHLCLIRPAINEDAGILTLSYPGTAAGLWCMGYT